MKNSDLFVIMLAVVALSFLAGCANPACGDGAWVTQDILKKCVGYASQSSTNDFPFGTFELPTAPIIQMCEGERHQTKISVYVPAYDSQNRRFYVYYVFMLLGDGVRRNDVFSVKKQSDSEVWLRELGMITYDRVRIPMSKKHWPPVAPNSP